MVPQWSTREAIMATITVKNIPDDLYENLKLSAGANHRSINREVIACIERAVQSRRVDPEVVLARARELRDKIGGRPITDAEFTRAKNKGRP
jgi:plasmid stability protein